MRKTLICLALILMATIFVAMRPAPSTGSNLLDGPGRMTFAELGWQTDMELSNETPSAFVELQLQVDAKQGDPLWYGIELKFEWYGNPGHAGEYAQLHGLWNDNAVYQFQTEGPSAWDSGYKWSMVDLVNGYSSGYELTDKMSVSSSNVAQISSISGGRNSLEIFLQSSDASNKNIRVVVSKESNVFATSWQPTQIDGKADVDIDGNIALVNVQGKNLGWGAPRLTATTIIWTNGEKELFNTEIAPLAPLADFQTEEAFTRSTKQKPERIDVELDWGSGRTYYLVLHTTKPVNQATLFNNPIFRSTIGLLIASVVLWISVPVLISRIRQYRQR